MSDSMDLETINRLRTALMQISRRIDRQIVGAGLTSTQLSILTSVALKGPIGLSELAEVERVNPTMLSRIVSRLEDDGLIRRQTGASDRRVVRVEITPAGARIRTRLAAERTKLLAERVTTLPAATVSALADAIPALEELAAQLAPPAGPTTAPAAATAPAALATDAATTASKSAARV